MVLELTSYVLNLSPGIITKQEPPGHPDPWRKNNRMCGRKPDGRLIVQQHGIQASPAAGILVNNLAHSIGNDRKIAELLRKHVTYHLVPIIKKCGRRDSNPHASRR